MKLILTAIMCVTISICNTYAQQLPLYSQYLNNEFIINPAFTGNKGESSIQLGFRNQWIGFKGAPSMYSFGGQTTLKKKNMGIGGLLFANNTGGAIKQTGGLINYSYFAKMTPRAHFAFGLSASLNEYSFDGSNIQAKNPNDVSLFTSVNAFVPDVNFGIALINNDLKIGFAINQLLETKIKNWNQINMQTTSKNELINHFNFSISNKYKINKKVEMEPYFVTRNISINTLQFDIGSRVTFKNKMFGSIGYRLKDAFIIALGIKQNNFIFSYSYDATTSIMRKYSYGSHEIILKYVFKTSKYKRH
jgi:type IX secretion system PorP/SprF family membrane protein